MIAALDSYAKYISPWDFSIKIDGKTFPTRPLTLADVAVLEGFQKNKGTTDFNVLIEFITGIFSGAKKPDVGKWPPEYLPLVIGELGNYWMERSKKNAAAISAAVKNAQEEATGNQSGN